LKYSPSSGRTMRTRSLFLLAALALCAGCADYSGGDNAASEGAVQTVIDLNLFEMKGGTTTWTLDTNSAEFDAAKQKARLSHPLIKLYEGKDLVTEVSAKQGLMDMESGDFTLTKSVKAQSLKEKITLTGEKLIYASKRKRIWTDEPVEINQRGATVKGQGLEASPDLSEITINQQSTKIPEKLDKDTTGLLNEGKKH